MNRDTSSHARKRFAGKAFSLTGAVSELVIFLLAHLLQTRYHHPIRQQQPSLLPPNPLLPAFLEPPQSPQLLRTEHPHNRPLITRPHLPPRRPPTRLRRIGVQLRLSPTGQQAVPSPWLSSVRLERFLFVERKNKSQPRLRRDDGRFPRTWSPGSDRSLRRLPSPQGQSPAQQGDGCPAEPLHRFGTSLLAGSGQQWRI